MLTLFRDGIFWGIGLSFMIGPIFFALIQAGITRGFRAAIILSAGVWFSDLLYIILTYSGVTFLMDIIHGEHFKIYTGLIGGLILIGSGVSTLIKSRKALESNNSTINIKDLSDWSLFIKGFLVNTFNPFTVFFWIALNTNMASYGEFTKLQATVFFGALWGTIVVTDILKAFLAKKIKDSIRPFHILWIRLGCGIALIIFGVVLMFRSFM